MRSKAPNGATSTWSNSFRVTTVSDVTAPNPITSLTWNVNGSSFLATWIKPTLDSNGNTLKDFNGYLVTVTANSISKNYIVMQERFDFDYNQNVGAFGAPEPVVQISVKVRDIVGNLSTAVTDTASNPIPADASGFVADGIHRAISLSWDATAEDDLRYFELYMSTSGSGFTPGPSNLITQTLATSFVFPTVNPVTHYFKLRQVDMFNQGSSAYVSANAVPELSTDIDITPPDDPSSVTVSSTEDGRGSATILVDWVASPSTNLGGYVVRYSTDEIAWRYVSVPADQASATLENLATDTDYYVAVAAITYVNVYSDFVNASTYPITTAQDTAAPSKPSAPSVSTGTLLAQVSHDMTRNAGGDLESDTDYLEVHASTTTGFTPSDSTLRGTIATAGTGISVSGVFPYVSTDSTVQLYWKIIAVDKSGNKSVASNQIVGLPGLIEGQNVASATITNAKIQDLSAAKLIAGTAFVNDLSVQSSLTLDAVAGKIKSNNYNVGSQTGWQLDQSGLVIYDGSVYAKSLLLQDSANISPPVFADFEFSSDYYHDVSNVGNALQLTASTNMLLSILTSGQKVGKQALRLWNTSISSATTHSLHFATGGQTATGVNIDVDPGDYIYSVWAKKNGAVNQNIKLSLYTDTSVAVASSNILVSSSTMTRYSAVLTVPSGVSKLKMYVDVTPTTTGYDLLVDALQLERKISASTSPSVWRPPSTTTIDGGAIVTGSIRSSSSSATVPGQPAWSINTQGNMQIGDALVRGSLIIGGAADGKNIIPSTYSSFEKTSTIYHDGSDVFNSATLSTGDAGWKAHILTSGAHDGNQALRLYNNSFSAGGTGMVFFTGENQLLSGNNIKTVPGQNYVVSLYVKTNDAAKLPNITLVQWVNASIFQYVGSPVTLTTSWQRVSGTLTAASSSLQLAIEADAPGVQTSVDFIVDGLQMELGSTPTAFQETGVQLSAVQSANYVSAVQGWAINSEGSVEFNDGTFRGAIDIVTSLNSKQHVVNLQNKAANWRGSVNSVNYNLAGPLPTILMRGTAFVPDGSGLSPLKDVQTVFRMTPEGGTQLMFDPSQGNNIFNIDGNNDFNSSNTFYDRYYGYSDFRTGFGVSRIWNQTLPGTRSNDVLSSYPDNSFYSQIYTNAQAPTAISSTFSWGGFTSSSYASNNNGYFRPQHLNKIKASSSTSLVSKNVIPQYYDTFNNGGGTTFYNTAYKTLLSVAAIVTNQNPAQNVASSITWKSLQISLSAGTTPEYFFGTSATDYNVSVTAGDKYMLSAGFYFPTAMNGRKIKVVCKTNNGIEVVSSDINIHNDGLTNALLRHGNENSLITIPAGATSALFGFRLVGTFTAQTFYMSLGELVKLKNAAGDWQAPFNVEDFLARSQTASLSGVATLNVNAEPNVRLTHNTYIELTAYAPDVSRQGFLKVTPDGTKYDFYSEPRFAAGGYVSSEGDVWAFNGTPVVLPFSSPNWASLTWSDGTVANANWFLNGDTTVYTGSVNLFKAYRAGMYALSFTINVQSPPSDGYYIDIIDYDTGSQFSQWKAQSGSWTTTGCSFVGLSAGQRIAFRVINQTGTDFLVNFHRIGFVQVL